MTYKLLETCRAQGCPVCRLEQQSVERYLDSQFYENVNSPKWRDHLRSSLGFCHEHAWLAVNKRLGDSLGFTIIYHDIVNHVLTQLTDDRSPAHTSRHWTSALRRIPEQARIVIEKMLAALTPRKRCPVCEHRDQTTRAPVSVLVEELETPEIGQALQTSDGLCFPHLRLALEHVRDVSVAATLLNIHREKLESLRTELAEFISKNDYQRIEEGFGKERDAWLRTIGAIVGERRGG